VPELVGVITPEVTADSPLTAIGSEAVISTPAIVAIVVEDVVIVVFLLEILPEWTICTQSEKLVPLNVLVHHCQLVLPLE